MSSHKRPLTPGFLNRFDKYLLTNQPEVWSARTHLVVYYGVLFAAALAVLSFVIPDDPRGSSPMFYWIGFVVIISIIALTVWLIYLLRFNVFKRYGNITPLSRLRTFVLYFIAIGIIVLFPLIMPVVESVRANNAYSDNEVINDINAINIKICQLEYDSLPHDLKQDTILVVSGLPQYRTMPEDEDDTVPDTVTVTGSYPAYTYRRVDTASLHQTLAGADSSARLNDSMYVLLNSRNYTFIHSYNSSSFYRQPDAYTVSWQPEVYANFYLYNHLIRNFKAPADRREVRTGLYALLNKYKLVDETAYAYGYDGYNEGRDNYDKIMKKYELSQINRNIDNVTERKYRWRDDTLDFVVRFCYYATLILTLLIFAYRHSTQKAFFLSLLAAVILTILTSLFEAYFSGQHASGYIWLIVYTLLFFIISLFSFRSKIRYTVVGIGINLFVFVVAFFPSSVVAYYYALAYDDMNNQTAKNVDRPTNFIDYETMHRAMLYAEIGGSLLLLLLLATYIQKVYRKWYALPEE